MPLARRGWRLIMANATQQRIASLLAKRVTTALPKRAAAPPAPAPLPRSNANFLTTPEGRIAYDDVGKGPLLVMVPSLGDLRQEYRLFVPPLLASGFRVVTMDLRGHGESSV